MSRKKRENCEDFADILYQRRHALGLSKPDIAKQLRVTDSAVGHWENGTHRPPARKMAVLAKLLHMPVAELRGDVPLSTATMAPMTFDLPAFLCALERLIAAAEEVRSALDSLQAPERVGKLRNKKARKRG